MFNDAASVANAANAARSTLHARMKSMIYDLKIAMRSLEIAPLTTYPARQIATCAVDLASLALEYERLVNAEILASRAADLLDTSIAFAIFDTDNPA